MKRRDFVKTVAMSGMAIAASDTIADLLAQSPKGRVLESKFKGLADVALTEAKRLGCTYADIRFTRNTNSGVNASGGNRDAAEALSSALAAGAVAAVAGRRRRGGGRGGGAFGGGNAGPAPAAEEAAGFGVRVIHSGVWGFASSPIVTEDEIRRITRMASEVAKASAIAKKIDVRLAPVPAYTDYWVTPMEKDPAKVPQTDKQALVQKVVDLAVANKEVLTVNATISLEHEWKYFASSEGSYIEQEIYTTTPNFT